MCVFEGAFAKNDFDLSWFLKIDLIKIEFEVKWFILK